MHYRKRTRTGGRREHETQTVATKKTHLDRLTPLRLFLHEIYNRVLMRRRRRVSAWWRSRTDLILRFLFLFFAL
jgi:hypothetical protein